MLNRRDFLRGLLGAGVGLTYGNSALAVMRGFKTAPLPGGRAEALFPVRLGGKYGYINKTGDVVIKPQFDWAFRFSDGFAPVKVGNHFGFIDTNGEMAIRPRFTSPSTFCEALADFKDPDTKLRGYINKTGKVVIEPRFEQTSDFKDGLASVLINGRWGCINNKGKVVIKPMSDHSITFSEGLAPVLIDGTTGYIDKTGAFVIPLTFEYESALSFREGLACVYTPFEEPFYIDKTGKVVIKLDVENADSFYDGLAAVHKDGRSGFIDKTGRVVIDFTQFDVIRFSEGMCRICNISDKYGFINREGTIVVEPRFDWAEDFDDGLAYVEIYGKQGYVDRKGGYIDKTGRYVWEPTA